ncbi:MAG: methyltransferase domain-containing protein [Calditrichae bacterium]|nr:methyltransferase domain-containing protein [Calditrichia bacterium]
MNPEFWDTRYRDNPSAYGDKPNDYLAQKSYLFKPGMKILAVGEGEGRNALWLSEKKYEVWMVDYSKVGLNKASMEAKRKNLNLKLICADLAMWHWPVDYFDAVLAIFLHLPPAIRSQVHCSMLQSLKSGGIIIMQLFHTDQLKYGTAGPKSPEMLYTADMLQQDFQNAQILDLEETVLELNEGLFHTGAAAVINLTLQKN